MAQMHTLPFLRPSALSGRHESAFGHSILSRRFRSNTKEPLWR